VEWSCWYPCEYVGVLVDDVGSGWMVNRINNGFNFYFNVETMEKSWYLPESAMMDKSLLTHADIQVADSRIGFACFSFHAGLLVITLLSVKLHTENNTCMLLLEMVGGSEKSRF